MLRQTHFNHGILFQKLFLTVRKKCFSKEKLFKITQTIYLNSERSKQFLKQNSLICYWRFLYIYTLEQLKCQLKQIIGM